MGCWRPTAQRRKHKTCFQQLMKLRLNIDPFSPFSAAIQLNWTLKRSHSLGDQISEMKTMGISTVVQIYNQKGNSSGFVHFDCHNCE